MNAKEKNPTYRWAKYGYDIRTVKAGQKIAVLCNHDECNRFLVMTVIDTSTMSCYCHRHKNSFDMRNQVWTCHQHSKTH